MKIEKSLKALGILQEKKVKQRLGYYVYRRLNPWNPLTYLAILIMFVLVIVLYGVIGFYKEMSNTIKELKWN